MSYAYGPVYPYPAAFPYQLPPTPPTMHKYPGASMAVPAGGAFQMMPSPMSVPSPMGMGVMPGYAVGYAQQDGAASVGAGGGAGGYPSSSYGTNYMAPVYQYSNAPTTPVAYTHQIVQPMQTMYMPPPQVVYQQQQPYQQPMHGQVHMAYSNLTGHDQGHGQGGPTWMTMSRQYSDEGRGTESGSSAPMSRPVGNDSNAYSQE